MTKTKQEIIQKYVGSTITNLVMDIVDNPDSTSENEHEVMFIRIHTSVGVLSICNHVGHNGHYGRFFMKEIVN